LRLEFQFRRKVLVEFHLRSVEDTLASIQDLWRYAAGDWLSLRTPTVNRQRTRWPVDSLWRKIQAIELAPSSTGVVRHRLEQATLERIVQGLWGYVTSLAALHGAPAPKKAFVSSLVHEILIDGDRAYHRYRIHITRVRIVGPLVDPEVCWEARLEPATPRLKRPKPTSVARRVSSAIPRGVSRSLRQSL